MTASSLQAALRAGAQGLDALEAAASLIIAHGTWLAREDFRCHVCPRSDDDTPDIIDDALGELARRRGAWIGDDITAMTMIASLIEQAERFLPEMVTNARMNRHSWDEVARAIGTSPEEAHLRFGPESPVADSRWPYDF